MMHHNEGANEKHGKVELFWEGDIQTHMKEPLRKLREVWDILL